MFINSLVNMDDLRPKKKKKRKGLIWFIGILILALGIFTYVRYYYVFGTGVKSGELNYLVYKGVIFKTYEGKLIDGTTFDKGVEAYLGAISSSVSGFKEVLSKMHIGDNYNIYIPWKQGKDK